MTATSAMAEQDAAGRAGRETGAVLLDIVFADGSGRPSRASVDHPSPLRMLFVDAKSGVAPLIRRDRKGRPMLAAMPLDGAAAARPGELEAAWPGALPEALIVTVDPAFGRRIDAWLMEPDDLARHPDTQVMESVGLWSLGPQLAPDEAALAARATALLNWHRRAGHCGACGAVTLLCDDGVSRRCTAPNCALQVFPRLDTVAMTLVTCGNRCLLGRQPRFAEGLFSGFAGFVENGETLEQAAFREVREEAGIDLSSVVYRFSQPWPFPHALTVGFRGEVAPGARARADGDEIAAVAWFDREQVCDMLASVDQPGRLRMPGPISLAHQLARDWLADTH